MAYVRDFAAGPLGDDLISDLRRDGLSADELVATAVLLLMAGHEATVNVLGNGVYALLTHRSQWEGCSGARSCWTPASRS